jgi:Lipocalin-like domain
MKRLLLLAGTLTSCTTVILGFAPAANRNRKEDVRVQGRFVGGWRLASLEEPDAEGAVHRADCTGLLVFTRDGQMSVQVMYRNPHAGAQSGPVQYAQGGYEASFGTYRINESTHTFTFHVDGAMVRSLIGKDLPRSYELSGKQLIVKSTNPNEHWRVAWEHY